MNGAGYALALLPVSVECRPLENSGLDVSQRNVAHLYLAYAQYRKNGTSEASSFADAVQQHKVIDQMFRTSDAVFG